jgi:hypothetical protein
LFALDARDDSEIMSLPVHQITKERRDIIAMLPGNERTKGQVNSRGPWARAFFVRVREFPDGS